MNDSVMRLTNKKQNRNIGIDLLRLVSMFYVVILHILGYGGVCGSANDVLSFAICWFLKTFAYCAVNIYALISGYVGYNDKEKSYKYSRYVDMWLQVVFWGMLITTYYFVTKPGSVGLKHYILSVLPVIGNQYWYFTAYTGLFFIIPFLNKFIRFCSKRFLTGAVVTIFVIFSCFSTVAGVYSDPFYMNKGFSFLWITFVYIIGAYIKKYDIPKAVNTKIAILLGCALLFITYFSKLGIRYLTISLFGHSFREDFLLVYTSPTILGIAIVYLIIFSKIKIRRSKKIIEFLAPSAFGVYLFHMQHLFLDNDFSFHFSFIADLPLWLIPLSILWYALIIFIIGLLIDKVRSYIFKFIRVNKFTERIELVASRLFNKFYDKIQSVIDDK